MQIPRETVTQLVALGLGDKFEPVMEIIADMVGGGTRLSKSWKPEQADIDFASKALGGIELAREEFRRFRDYWTARIGPRGLKRDWPATWRNWIRKAAKDGKQKRTVHQAAGSLVDKVRALREQGRISGDEGATNVLRLPSR